jgi:transcription termination factor NusB
MPLTQQASELEIKEQLASRMAHCKTIIEGLKHYEPFQMLLKDVEETRKRIDSSWHLATDEKQIAELRITKLAIMEILGMVDHYQADYDKALKQLAEISSPEEIVQKDYDLEGGEKENAVIPKDYDGE